MNLENDEITKFGKIIKDDKNSSKKEKVIEKGDKVKFDYTLTLKNGIVIDTSIPFESDHSGILDISRKHEPLKIIVGNNTTLKGLEEGMIGLNVGDKKVFRIPPKDAYGMYDSSKKKVIHKDHFDGKIGEQIIIKDSSGKLTPCWVSKVEGNQVVLDLNHPLAGKEIIVDIKIIGIE
ncbi:MAG: FKBP-type peptidyl-prolyl cis-trans isomerase [Candidatus Woesearchaeota archaeon]